MPDILLGISCRPRTYHSFLSFISATELSKIMNRWTVILATIALTFLSAGVVAPQAFATVTNNGYAHTFFVINKSNVSPDSTTVVGLTPTTIYSVYGFNSLSCSGSKSCGSGQTIAIVDAFDDPNIESDLGVFSTAFSLPACTTANGCFTKAEPQGSPITNRSWALEISLDVEWAHAIAPGAKILLVEAKSNSNANLFGAVDYAAKQAGVHQVSMSWGGSESSSETSSDSHFRVSGVTFTASSGDGGHGIIYPSASPNVVSVGGTTLNFDRFGNFVGETAWSGSGGGISAYESEPSYQTNFPIPNTGGLRGNPDVSYDADPSSGVAVYDSLGDQGFKDWIQVGGTSAGAPQWAALFAIANAGRTSPLGSTSSTTPTNTAVYSIAKTAYSTNFRDITSGTNGSCGTLCTATTGYDFVTGLGSPLANNLVGSLSKA
jgi:subtilase family serine protease